MQYTDSRSKIGKEEGSDMDIAPAERPRHQRRWGQAPPPS